MITVRKLAARFGLSRSTLLYYDRIGLLRPSARSAAGYRLYDADSAERLRLICSYKNAGLGLQEIADLLAADPADAAEGDRAILRRRLDELDEQISGLRVQQRALVDLLKNQGDAAPSITIERESWVSMLRASGMDDADMQRWHHEFERNAPAAHRSFLRWLGIPEDEIRRIRKTAEAT